MSLLFSHLGGLTAFRSLRTVCESFPSQRSSLSKAGISRPAHTLNNRHCSYQSTLYDSTTQWKTIYRYHAFSIRIPFIEVLCTCVAMLSSEILQNPCPLNESITGLNHFSFRFWPTTSLPTLNAGCYQITLKTPLVVHPTCALAMHYRIHEFARGQSSAATCYAHV